MSSTAEVTRDELAPFFGNDGRARLFIRTFLDGNYESSINEANPSDLRNNSLALNVMRCANYESSAKLPDMSDNDVHYEFTDFLVQTALFHRGVDKATGIGPMSYDLKENLRRNVDARGPYFIGQVKEGVRPDEAARGLLDYIFENNTEGLRALEGASSAYGGTFADKVKNYVGAVLSRVTRESNDQTVLGEVKDAVLKAFNEASAAGAAPAYSRASEEAELLWNNVYQKRATLSSDAKKFYNKYVQFLDGTNVLSLDGGADYDVNNKDRYRINLIKTRLGEREPLFVNLIPKYDSGSLNNVWYVTSSGRPEKANVTQSAPSVDMLFKKLYSMTYSVDNGTVDGNGAVFTNLPTTWDKKVANTKFDLNVRQLIRKRLFCVQQAMKTPTPETAPLLSFTDKGIWHRDSEGRLYRQTSKGKVMYGESDEGTNEALKEDFKCYSTLVRATNKDDCNKYMTQCLMSKCLSTGDPQDIAGCKEFWKRQDFFRVAKEDISSMHPSIAVKTLQKYGFRVHEEYDPECGMRITKVESRDHWVKNYLKKGKKFDEESMKLIEDNESLLNYLQLLSEYVNANPSILNGKTFTAKTAESMGRVNQTQLAIDLKIPMRKEPKKAGYGAYDYGMLRSHLDSSFFGQTARKRTVFPPVFRSPFSETTFSVGLPYQSGGFADLSTYYRRRDEGLISGAEALSSIIQSTIADLENMGKKIDEGNMKSLAEKIHNMKTIEHELIKTEKYLEEYRNMVELFRDYKSELLTLDDIAHLADKQRDLQGKQLSEEASLVKILGSLQSLLAGKSGDFIESGYRPLEY